MYRIEGLITGIILAVSFILLLDLVPGDDLIRFAQAGIDMDIRIDLSLYQTNTLQLTIVSIIFIATTSFSFYGILFKRIKEPSDEILKLLYTLFVAILIGLVIFLCYTLASFISEKIAAKNVIHTFTSIVLTTFISGGVGLIVWGLWYIAEGFGKTFRNKPYTYRSVNRYGRYSRYSYTDYEEDYKGELNVTTFLISFSLTISFWLFLLNPTVSTSPPVAVQIARLERTATAQQLQTTLYPQATQVAYQRTITAQALQATANALSVQVGQQSAAELATLQAQATENARNNNQNVGGAFVPTENFQPTIAALQLTLDAPNGQNNSRLVDTESLLGDGIFQFLVATFLSILSLFLAFVQVKQGRR